MSANTFGLDWAQLESGTFRFRDPLNKERRFIPLRLDDAPIRGSLAQFLYINWLPPICEQEYVKLLEACGAPAKAPISEIDVFGFVEKQVPTNRGSTCRKAVWPSRATTWKATLLAVLSRRTLAWMQVVMITKLRTKCISWRVMCIWISGWAPEVIPIRCLIY